MIRLDEMMQLQSSRLHFSLITRLFTTVISVFIFTYLTLFIILSYDSRTLILSQTQSLTHTLSHCLTHLLTYSINHCPTFLFSLSSTNSRGGGGGGVDFLGCMPINLSRRNLMNVQRYGR